MANYTRGAVRFSRKAPGLEYCQEDLNCLPLPGARLPPPACTHGAWRHLSLIKVYPVYRPGVPRRFRPDPLEEPATRCSRRRLPPKGGAEQTPNCEGLKLRDRKAGFISFISLFPSAFLVTCSSQWPTGRSISLY